MDFNFMEYTNLYTWKEKDIRGSATVYDISKSFDLRDGKLRFSYSSGNKYHDLIFCGCISSFLLSSKTINLLLENNIIGWKAYPAIIYDKKDNIIDGYSLFEVIGRCGTIDWGKSEKFKKQFVPNAPFADMLRGIYPEICPLGMAVIFLRALGSGFRDGLIGVSGGLIGGIGGGIDAALDGRRFWDGATVQKTTLVKHNIPIVGQRGENDCLPASVEAVDRSFGGDMTQKDVRTWKGFEGDDPLEDAQVWSTYSNKSGHSLDFYRGGDKLSDVLSNMQSRNRVALNLQPLSGDVGHSVVMQRVVHQTVTKINGTVTQKLFYYVMNPAGGYIQRISSSSIINTYNIFYILP